MIKTIFSNSFPASTVKSNAILTKSYNKNYLEIHDLLTKTHNNNQISFFSNKLNTHDELRKLQNEYLSLHFPFKNQPQNIFAGDGLIIERAILSGEKVENLLTNHKQDFATYHLTENIFGGIYNGTPVIELLKNYKTFVDKRKELLGKIASLSETSQQNIPEKPENERTKQYKEFIKKSVKGSLTYDASSPFRYTSLEEPFKAMITAKSSNQGNKAKVLVVGMGKKAEELYDYSTYAYDTIKNTGNNLTNILDIESVDLTSAKDMQRDYLNPPQIDFLNSPFDKSNLLELLIYHPDNKHDDIQTYPVNVLDFVAKQLEDKDKLHTSTSIEDFSQNYKGEGYDFISLNNVLQYPGYGEKDKQTDINDIPENSRFLNPFRSELPPDSKEYNGFRELLTNIFKMVKPDGYLACRINVSKEQNKLYDFINQIDTNKEFKLIQPGLYQRKTNQ